MKKILLFSIIIALVIMAFKCNGKSSLDFEEVKFNTPEMVITELGFKDLPKFSYVGNTVNSEFNWDYWDCLVEFQFEDTLSIKEKEAIIQYAKGKDKFQWKYKELPKNGVIEFYNIKYGEADTIPYNIVITNDKVYVAYKDKVDYPDLSDFLDSNDFHLIAEKNSIVGVDASHQYAIKFKQPYSQYINKLNNDELWKCEETSHTISYAKYLYGDDGTTLQTEYKIIIDKKNNSAIVEYGSF